MLLLYVQYILLRSYLIHDFGFCLRALKTSTNAYTESYFVLLIQIVTNHIKNIRRVRFCNSATHPVQGEKLADISNKRLSYYVYICVIYKYFKCMKITYKMSYVHYCLYIHVYKKHATQKSGNILSPLISTSPFDYTFCVHD